MGQHSHQLGHPAGAHCLNNEGGGEEGFLQYKGNNSPMMLRHKVKQNKVHLDDYKESRLSGCGELREAGRNEMEMRKRQRQTCRLPSTPAESKSAFLQAAGSCAPHGRAEKGWARATVCTQLQLGITGRAALGTHSWPTAGRSSEWV
ncbi:hypothetical protein HJG60_011114 [Phyllostomus discolor]|uniref:Uncharacterized protein n=1 Tax=Phyllostomus discolor TaxID=89673 RepID=A0A834E1C3_9CHIR|nr:hypothetical protein HJG60_011114 [Phyllostomus discolor]